jgi:hypothetical protein
VCLSSRIALTGGPQEAMDIARITSLRGDLPMPSRDKKSLVAHTLLMLMTNNDRK